MQVLTMPKFMDRHCIDSRSRDLRRRPKAGLGRRCSRLRRRAAEHRSRPGCSTAVPPPSTGGGTAAEAAERLLRSQPKVCSKCVSHVRPAPCHACCMKQTPRDSSSRIEVSPLFVSSPRPKRPSPPGVYVSTTCPRFPLFVTYLWSQEQPRPSASRCRPLRGNAPPLPLRRLPSHAPI